MATVDAREIKVVVSNKSGGRLEPVAGVPDDIVIAQVDFSNTLYIIHNTRLSIAKEELVNVEDRDDNLLIKARTSSRSGYHSETGGPCGAIGIEASMQPHVSSSPRSHLRSCENTVSLTNPSV